jgi:hypothetical protein
MRRHLTYANVTATLALVFAMGGGALAASHYVITSTSQIKPSVLRQLKAGGKVVVHEKEGPPGAAGPKGLDSTLPGRDGATGAVGITGPAGPPGLTTPLGEVKVIVGSGVELEPGEVAEATATCPAGEHAITGGEFNLLKPEQDLQEEHGLPILTTESALAVERVATIERLQDHLSATWRIVVQDTFAANVTVQAWAGCFHGVPVG